MINVKHVESRGISGQIRRRLDLQRNQVHVLHCFVRIRSWDLPPKSATDEQLPKNMCFSKVLCYNVTKLCSRMTSTYHRSTLNKTPLFESKCFQAKIVVVQNKTRRRRTIHGVVDATTVHHQSSKSLASVCQLRKSSCQKHKFLQAQTYVDSFVIAIFCCLRFCCR